MNNLEVEENKCITVRQLKELIKNWPETDAYGEETEVWIKTDISMSSRCVHIGRLNYRKEENGEEWADLILVPRSVFYE